MAIEIRPAEAADFGGIQVVAEAAWHEAHAPIIGTEAVEHFLADYYRPDAFEPLVDRDDTLLEVAVDDGGAIVGFVSAVPDDTGSTIHQLGRLYVTPDRWGEGIGGRLLDRAEHRVRALGGERISLGVMAENDRAVGFYEAAGFQRTDTFYDDRIDAIGYTYEKPL